MSDRSTRNQELIKPREKLLAAILIAGLFAALATVLFPEFGVLFFLIICGLACFGIIIFRESAIATRLKPRSKNSEYLKTDGRDALILQSFAKALQHPAYILNSKSNVLFANPTAETTFGGTRPNEWIFLKFRQPKLRQLVESAISSRKPQTMTYNETVPKDRWFAVEVAPIPRLSDKAPKEDKLFLLSFHDLTEAKRTEKMRSDFIANASHELRTPLASLSGYIETIKGPARNDPKAFDRFTDVMLNQAQRMTRLVNDLLSLSRIEMQSHVRPSALVNLSEIVTSVVVSLEALAQQLGVEVEFEPSPGIFVQGDRDELLQVFENLIENACKYGQDGKRVVVGFKHEVVNDQKTVRVFVKDFGPGIDPDDQSRITERFYRVDVARSREKQGTGLGLAIVKHILNRHDTRLAIESVLGEGATFSVRFSVKEPE